MNNTRILVIDDEEIVRDSIREILFPRKKDDSDLLEASLDLFDEEEPILKESYSSYQPAFIMDEANNGKSGLEKVKLALEKGEPYAVIFLDMRMPGWDGLTTCMEIRKIDPKAQVFFVTAFTDRSIDEIIHLAGGDVGYLSKPFVAEEIIQLATKGIYDWQRLINLERLLEIVGQIGVASSQLNTLLINILHQISDYVGTDYAVLGKLLEGADFEVITQIGVGGERVQLDQLFKKIDLSSIKEVKMTEGFLVCPIEQYCIIALPSNSDWFNQEKVYLLHLFVENAVRAIKNTELNSQLVQKEKLSAVGQAISMVMHDIKTPIAQIRSLTEFIKEDPLDEDNTLEMTDMILEASEHAMEIISDVKDFVSNAKLRKERIDLHPYLSRIVEDVKKDKERENLKIDLEMEGELLSMGDPQKLKRVVVNLINNAYEAMEGNGIESPSIWLKASTEEEQVKLSIEDNGPGIPPKILKSLFEPFVTEGKAEGTGLGLAIVKQIVQAHQGQIEVSSSSAGAKFHISLPSA